MDPLSIAAGALSIIGSLYGVSAFIKGSTGMRRSGRALLVQVDGLVKVLNTLRATLDVLASKQLVDENDNLWQHIGESIKDCKATTDELLVKLDPVSNPLPNHVRQAWRNMRLGLSQDDLRRLMGDMRTHSINLQLSMEMVNALLSESCTDKIITGQASGFERLERMIMAIDSKLQSPSTSLHSAAHDDVSNIVLNDNTIHLREAALSIMSDASSEGTHTRSGATDCQSTWDLASAFSHLDLHDDHEAMHEDSTTGSELGPEMDDVQRNHIDSWRHQMAPIDEASETTAMSPGPDDLVSIFSETSTGLETRATDVSADLLADYSDDEEDDDVDFQVAQSLFSSANTKFEDKQFGAAEKLFKSSLEQSQHLGWKQQEVLNVKQMRLNYAICKLRIGKLEESEKLFLTIVNEAAQSTSDPAEKDTGMAKRVFEAYHGLASVHLRKGNFDAAENHCRQAVKGRKKKRLIATHPENYFDSIKLYAAILRAKDDTIRSQAFLDILPSERKLSITDLDEALRSEFFYEAKSKNENRTLFTSSPKPEDLPEPGVVPKDVVGKAAKRDSFPSRHIPLQRSVPTEESPVRKSFGSRDNLSLSKTTLLSPSTSVDSSSMRVPSYASASIDHTLNISSTAEEISKARNKVKQEGFFKPTKGNEGLLWAAKKGKLHELNVILDECQVDVNTQATGRREARETPLFLAVAKGFIQICVRLILASANLDIPNSQNETPLVKAVKNGNVRICELLLQHGANVNGIDHGGRPLVSAAGFAKSYEPLKKPASLEMCQLLVSCGADVNAMEFKGASPLMKAAGSGNKEVCLFLLDSSAEIDRIDGDGWTALMHAAGSDQLDICRMLLNHGANYSAKNFRNKSALDLMPHLPQKQALAAHWAKLQPNRRS